ncbi:MAG: EF-hand domain-containing protein [Salaquimonas sp.]|jgi:Ca2+-binding EF-hand superfamily protein|nr:EF-hand domain-containing protein [Salaquimonas sp.]
MKTSTKVILAGLAVTAVAGSAYAAQNWHRYGPGAYQRMGKAMFDKIDTNNDGAVSQDEMTKALGFRFDEADTNKDGSVTKAEIIAAVESNAKFPGAKRFSGRISDRIVYQFDLDENGNVSRSEIENRANKVFALVDWNDDGKVEVAEIRRMAGMFGGRHHGMRGPGWGGSGWGPGAMHYRWGGTDGDSGSDD